MKSKRSLIPKSKAKTAYGLLSEVRALILAEPKRYDQARWISHGSGDNYPRCGTIGCVAGWVDTLKPSRGRHVVDRASAVLGLDYWKSSELFDGAAASGNGQTVRHAKLGAAHIRRFQKSNRAELLAKKV